MYANVFVVHPSTCVIQSIVRSKYVTYAIQSTVTKAMVYNMYLLHRLKLESVLIHTPLKVVPCLVIFSEDVS